jgi:hypothetical protein
MGVTRTELIPLYDRKRKLAGGLLRHTTDYEYTAAHLASIKQGFTEAFMHKTLPTAEAHVFYWEDKETAIQQEYDTSDAMFPVKAKTVVSPRVTER